MLIVSQLLQSKAQINTRTILQEGSATLYFVRIQTSDVLSAVCLSALCVYLSPALGQTDTQTCSFWHSEYRREKQDRDLTLATTFIECLHRAVIGRVTGKRPMPRNIHEHMIMSKCRQRARSLQAHTPRHSFSVP